jgi:hypothetical protein
METRPESNLGWFSSHSIVSGIMSLVCVDPNPDRSPTQPACRRVRFQEPCPERSPTQPARRRVRFQAPCPERPHRPHRRRHSHPPSSKYGTHRTVTRIPSSPSSAFVRPALLRTRSRSEIDSVWRFRQGRPLVPSRTSLPLFSTPFVPISPPSAASAASPASPASVVGPAEPILPTQPASPCSFSEVHEWSTSVVSRLDSMQVLVETFQRVRFLTPGPPPL